MLLQTRSTSASRCVALSTLLYSPLALWEASQLRLVPVPLPLLPLRRSGMHQNVASEFSVTAKAYANRNENPATNDELVYFMAFAFACDTTATGSS